jgi:hypothetical protein
MDDCAAVIQVQQRAFAQSRRGSQSATRYVTRNQEDRPESRRLTAHHESYKQALGLYHGLSRLLLLAALTREFNLA